VNSFDVVAIILGGVLALVIGLVIGWFLGRQNKSVSESEPDSFPDLVGDVLELMGSVGIVVDGSSKVVGTNSWAESFGLVARGFLVHSELVDLVKRARSGSEIESFEGILRVGLAGKSFGICQVQVGRR